MIRVLLPIYVVLALTGVLGTVWVAVMHNLYGLPYNPLRWAQERRRRDNKRRQARISALEHDLGYRPCSDSECLSCKKWDREVNQGHPIWDHPSLPAPPPPRKDLISMAYDRQVAYYSRILNGLSEPKRGGTVGGGPR